MESNTNVEEKIEFLAKSLSSSISSFEGKRKENKGKALAFKLSITALGAATTVLLGLKGLGPPGLFQNIALVFSALVTLLSTWDTFFSHRGLWVRYTQTVTELYGIQADLNYALSSGMDSITSDFVDGLYHRFSRCLQETNEWWQHARKDRSSSAGTG